MTYRTRIDRDIAEIARRHIEDDYYVLIEIPDPEFDAHVLDLAKELDAAIADRWLEWRNARKADLPFGQFVGETESHR